ncbi:MAG: hypothetical protein ABI806_20060 [Candidatus Solibacter sp.]
MLHALSPLLAVLVMMSLVPATLAVEPQRLAWDELHKLVGKQVSIPLYSGCAVSGRVVGVQADALTIDVSKSSHPEACPKGSLRVPRATLYVLDLNKKGIRYRVTDTTLDVLGAVGVSGNAPGPPRTTTIRIVR